MGTLVFRIEKERHSGVHKKIRIEIISIFMYFCGAGKNDFREED